MNEKSIQAILLDYGGTIDTNGRHWGKVLWQAYQHCHVPVEENKFRKIYTEVEIHLGRAALIQPHFDFAQTLRTKVDLQLAHLFSPSRIEPGWATHIVDYCMALVDDTLRQTRPVLEILGQEYRLAVVSNFYGNLPTVLHQFGLDKSIEAVVESAQVGLRKPDAAIFAHALRLMGLAPHQAVVVGDSVKNDISPAQSLGCPTMWLHGDGWKSELEEAQQLGCPIISTLTMMPIAMANWDLF